ncbi:MAG: hypothetical protein GX592_05880 [Clostridiales bacterium]|nr:hypothetical protein [Clostridiales bacterium]
MEKNLRSLNGLPVVLSGRKLGRVVQASVSEDFMLMEGLWVDAGLSGTRFVPTDAIQVLGEVSVTVDSPGKRLRMRERPLFRRAVTTDGARLGAVVGATVDDMSFQICSLIVSTGVFDDLFRGRLKIRRFQASLADGEVIVDTKIREGDFYERRNDQGPDYRRGTGRRGGDGLRHHELEDGAQMVPAGAANKQQSG